jgi:hypothetical protein
MYCLLCLLGLFVSVPEANFISNAPFILMAMLSSIFIEEIIEC